MLNKIVIGILVAALVWGVNVVSFAMSCHGAGAKAEAAEVTAEEAKSKAVNVGNKICPVSGEKIGSEGMKAETYEYKGKIYNFCCPMCIDEFKIDPERYIKKVEEELQSKSKEEIQKEKSSHEDMEGMHEGHHH